VCLNRYDELLLEIHLDRDAGYWLSNGNLEVLFWRLTARATVPAGRKFNQAIALHALSWAAVARQGRRGSVRIVDIQFAGRVK
jgi:hypothetical protein